MTSLLLTIGAMILGGLSFAFIGSQIIPIIVYGKWLSEVELDVYFWRHLNDYQLNEFSSSGELLHADFLPYISSSSGSRLSLCKWHIGNHGLIPRWSKWSKALDEKHASLLPIPVPRKKLSEL